QLKFVRLRLADLGFEVTPAAGAAEALALAREAPPDAIVSDVLMPGLDGFGFAAEARREPRLARVPVILVSPSYAEDADRRIADTLARRQGLAGVYDDVLASLLDASGVSRGALYVRDEDGRLALSAETGFEGAPGGAASFFGEPEIFSRAAGGGQPVVVPSAA